jgi:hypothetical protein
MCPPVASAHSDRTVSWNDQPKVPAVHSLDPTDVRSDVCARRQPREANRGQARHVRDDLGCTRTGAEGTVDPFAERDQPKDAPPLVRIHAALYPRFERVLWQGEAFLENDAPVLLEPSDERKVPRGEKHPPQYSRLQPADAPVHARCGMPFRHLRPPQGSEGRFRLGAEGGDSFRTTSTATKTPTQHLDLGVTPRWAELWVARRDTAARSRSIS